MKEMKLKMSDDVYDRIEVLRKDIFVEDRSDVLKYALATYEMLIQARKRGARILIEEKEGRTHELAVPPTPVPAIRKVP